MKNNTLIILDWDDTLFPSSWVADNSINNLLDPSVRIKYNKKFKEIDRLVSSLLTKAMSLGKTLIITNAMPTWVQLSGSLLRETNKIIKNIPVISARKDHGHIKNMKEWKKLSFLQEFKKHVKKRNITNIISIGDAAYEYKALVNLYNHQERHYDRLLKSIQLKRYPSFDTLSEQLSLMNNNIHKICYHRNHLDLEFDQH